MKEREAYINALKAKKAELAAALKPLGYRVLNITAATVRTNPYEYKGKILSRDNEYTLELQELSSVEGFHDGV